MKKHFLFLLLISQFSFFPPAFAQSQICLDIGQPIDNLTGQIYVNYGVIANTCTPNVRLNFILGPWNSPDDVTLHNGKTWKQTYDEIVDSLINRGITIYGLIGAQISYNAIGDFLINYPSDTQADSAQASQWEQDYVYNFVSVVDKFKDRIRSFESYNEPNNWDNGWTSVVCAKWFALMLQDIYLNTKYFNGHATDPLWQVNLISGPLFTFDLNDGSSYLNDTYNYGKNIWAWDWTHAQTGSYPLDGIGMHIYCAQGTNDSATVVNAMSANINAMYSAITNWEGVTNKQIWISEFGWESLTITEQGQADNLKNAFNLLLNDTRIGLATFFTIRDWPGYYWGMYYWGNFSAADRKLAYYEFLNITNCSPTSVAEMANEKPTLLFDASTGNYMLNFSGNEKIKIEIWNSLGEKISEIENKSPSISISKNSLGVNSGIYFLRVERESYSSVFKLIF
ncbi:MAG: T9SS type A sorting domain-containing protein [Bacteroidetes bacterium]|nr:T9SS type A sorting domain-containing protein [Bacteroidota bacterium]